MASTISLRYFLIWKIIALVMIYHVCYSNSLDTNTTPLCPTECDCTKADKVVCTGLATIPTLSNKSLIHSLTLTSHNLTELKVGDFADFTHLEQLDLSQGMIHTIEPGAFDDVKETIVRINLENNKLKEVGSGVFKDLKQVDEIILGVNHLGNLEVDSFVNLPELVTLAFNRNHIENIAKGAFKDLPKLANLNLYSNYLPEIPANAIDNLSSLKELTLGFNQIVQITETTNLLLPSLEEIVLDSNPITEITTFPRISETLKILNLQFTHLKNVGKATWKNCLGIERLHLSGTHLKSINEGTFDGLDNLNTLFIRNMPELESIGSNAFKGLPKLSSLHVASSPKLTHIAEDAFRLNNITLLFADECKLSNIPEKLLPWSRMTTVMIKKNPIKCDCNVKWMTNKTIFGNNTGVKSSFDELKCALPSSLKDAKVTTVHPDRFICHQDDHVKRLATGIIIVIICAVFMTIFALIMKFRKRILIYCRKYYQYRRYQNDLVFTVEHDTSIAELEDGDNMDGRPLKDMRLETVPLEM